MQKSEFITPSARVVGHFAKPSLPVDGTHGLVVEAFGNQYGVAVVVLDDGTRVQRAGDITTTYHSVGDCYCSNWPPADDGSYTHLAAELGFGTDLGMYNFEHELCHVLVPRVLFGERGYVSWMAAQRRKMSLAAAKAEERLIYYVQQAVSDASVLRLAPLHTDPQIAKAAHIVLAVRHHIAESAERSGASA